MTGMLERDDVQGNILTPYRREFTCAHYLLVSVAEPDGDARGLLGALLPSVTSMAGHRPSDGTALNVAVTYRGFARLGLTASMLAAFPDAFRARTRDRAEPLGDVGASHPDRWDDGVGTGRVHLIVTVHGTDEAALEPVLDSVHRAFATHGARVVHPTVARKLERMREHFGFADGAGQPEIRSVSRRRAGGGVPVGRTGWRPVELGEFVLGYPDEDGTTVTTPHPDLVRNGSYLVFRKLEQDVPAFRDRLRRAAAISGLPEELVAAKIVGRWRDGVPLMTHPTRPGVDDLADAQIPDPHNDFRYRHDDPDGEICPVGSHIRRTNPRDALTFDGAVKHGGAMTARHRIIRRGMPYGPPYGPPHAEKPDEGRGLVFVCYNADIARQFETIQAEWCANGNAFGLGADPDYLLGTPQGIRKMMIPIAGRAPAFLPFDAPVVITRGSEYALAPGLRALHSLATGGFD